MITRRESPRTRFTYVSGASVGAPMRCARCWSARSRGLGESGTEINQVPGLAAPAPAAIWPCTFLIMIAGLEDKCDLQIKEMIRWTG